MHLIIQEGLEDYLAGRVRRDFEFHLEQCAPCRAELEQIGSLSLLFHETFVTSASELAPAPGFYARLSETLEVRKSSSPWAFFSTDAVFGRRVAFASLLALALVGSFLVSRESGSSLEPQGPEAIIAQQNAEPHDATVDRDRMMITLASYER